MKALLAVLGTSFAVNLYLTKVQVVCHGEVMNVSVCF